MNLPANVQQAHNLILQQQEHFEVACVDERINFAREADFALQCLRNNSYLATVAQRNPESLKDAVKNIAQIGISLNPAAKHAYLVPRDNKVCLDIGYLGLIHLATESGAIEWVQAKHVHKNDDYTNNGVSAMPTHNYNAFGQRGQVIGVYCVAKTTCGDYLTTEMPLDELNRIKQRSPSASKGFSPWKSDEGAMQLKTVIKRAYKQWPKSDRLATAVDYLNNNGEGIDFAQEQRAAQRDKGDLNPTPEQVKEINNLLDDTDTDLNLFLSYFAGTIAKRDVPDIQSLTGKEAEQAIGMLRQKLAQMQAKQQQ